MLLVFIHGINFGIEKILKLENVVTQIYFTEL